MRPHDDELLRSGERVSELLDELRSMVGPPAWQRVEEIVQRLLELYGAGLERVLRHAVEVERESGALAARLRADELVSSLLVLHGLHPAPTSERVERALRELRARLGHELELVALDDDGTVRVRALGEGGGCGGTIAAHAIERFVLEAAPEVTRVEVEGLPPRDARGGSARGERLVQLRPRGREAR